METNMEDPSDLLRPIGPKPSQTPEKYETALSITTAYGWFEHECEEKNLTPNYSLFTLWLNAVHG
jgi:hypothetical protein